MQRCMERSLTWYESSKLLSDAAMLKQRLQPLLDQQPRDRQRRAQAALPPTLGEPRREAVLRMHLRA
jgi:hypothetical protein